MGDASCTKVWINNSFEVGQFVCCPININEEDNIVGRIRMIGSYGIMINHVCANGRYCTEYIKYEDMSYPLRSCQDIAGCEECPSKFNLDVIGLGHELRVTHAGCYDYGKLLRKLPDSIVIKGVMGELCLPISEIDDIIAQ